MHDHEALILSALLILLYGLVSNIAQRSPITAPIAFLGIGLLLSPSVLNVFTVDLNTDFLKVVAEATLIIILFVDATMIQFTKLRSVLAGVPARLLGIGLPLTMILGAIVASFLFPDLSFWSVALLALILSPTDAALGQAVVKSNDVPLNIRNSVSVESGLNDGIALPPILICIAVLASGATSLEGDGHWLEYIALQLTLGPLIGAGVGLYGGRLIEYAASRNWMEPVFQSLSVLSLSLLSFAAAEMVHGNGFIAAFCAGLMLGVRSHDVRERIQEFGEAQGQMLSLSIFLLVGLVAIPVFSDYWGWEAWLYAVLSLTVIRMLPVYISLTGSGLDTYSKLFIGWFGPRGIASLLYLLIVIADLGVTGYEQELAVIVLTVILSTFLHGVTALPLSNRFVGRESSDS